MHTDVFWTILFTSYRSLASSGDFGSLCDICMICLANHMQVEVSTLWVWDDSATVKTLRKTFAVR